MDSLLTYIIEKYFIQTSDIEAKAPSIEHLDQVETTQIYKPNNITYIKQVNLLFVLIQNILRDENQAVFEFRESSLFFNTIRVKFDFLSYNYFKLLSNEFRKKEIGTIGFDGRLEQEELAQFVYFFANAKVKEKNPFDDFETKIKKKGIKHIYLEKIHPYDLAALKGEEEVKKSAKKVFFKSITHLKEAFGREKQQKRKRNNGKSYLPGGTKIDLSQRI